MEKLVIELMSMSLLTDWGKKVIPRRETNIYSDKKVEWLIGRS